MIRSALVFLVFLPALTFGREAPLPIDRAFGYHTEVTANGLHVLFDIAEGYHLYLKRFKAEAAHEEVLIAAPIIPEGVMVDDPMMGKTEIIRGHVDIRVPILKLPNDPLNARIRIVYQGCQDEGSCYPPQRDIVDIHEAGLSDAKNAASVTECDNPSEGDAKDGRSEQCKIVDALKKESLLSTGLSFLGMGLLLAFTPCIFPMIPILSGLIAGHGKKIDPKRAFALSLSYVLASALAYTLFGVLAGLFGHNLQATLQNPTVIVLFSGFFVILALSMFGAFTLQMPNVVQTRLIQLSNRQKSGTLLGSAVMGFLSALIVGPCVAAPLAGTLIYIGETGDALFGGFALFSLGIGMGIPLLAVGTSAGTLLPKAGLWMETVKAFFGFGLLGIALWLFSRIAAPDLMLFLWAALAILAAVSLRALESLPNPSSLLDRFGKGLGILLLAYGLLLMIGAATSARDPFHPLEKLSIGVANQAKNDTKDLFFARIDSLENLEMQLADARKRQKTVLLDFYADWCTACQEMEHETFSDARVKATLSDVVLLKADVTESTDDNKALLRRFGLIGPPATLFFDAEGKEIKSRRIVGFLAPEPFNHHVLAALGHSAAHPTP